VKWISVDDGLPEAGVNVLLACWGGKHVKFGYRRRKEKRQRGGQWRIGGYCYEDSTVSHWMPLPDPPTE
jgi:hypothetical protein